MKTKFICVYDDEYDIVNVAKHRNGVGGAPLRVVLLRDIDTKKTIVVTQHQVPIMEDNGKVRYSTENASAYCVELLAAGDIEFGSNSYRGDAFAVALNEVLG